MFLIYLLLCYVSKTYFRENTTKGRNFGINYFKNERKPNYPLIGVIIPRKPLCHVSGQRERIIPPASNWASLRSALSLSQQRLSFCTVRVWLHDLKGPPSSDTP